MKLKKISAITLLLAIVLNISVFAEYTPPGGLWYANITRNTAALEGAVSTTPPEWKFKYEDQEFVLLDTYKKDGKNLFFVMTEGLYGTHKYSTATKETYGWFNPDDETNIAYWLNNDFWNNGNGGKALPEGIKKHIVEGEWKTEPLRDDAGTGHVPEGYKSTSIPPVAKSKLALLADWEWKAYISKIGYPGGTWFFRSVRTVDIKNSTNNILCGTTAVGYNSTVSATGDARGVRPVFLLDSAFFSNCKLSEVGSEVLKIIDSFANPDLYTDEERKAVFGWPDAVINGIGGNAVVGQTVDVRYDYYGVFEESNTEFRWLRSDNISSGFVEIPNANKLTYTITEADSEKYLKVQILPKCKSVLAPIGDWTDSPVIGPVLGATTVKKAIEEIKNASAENILSVIENYNMVFELDTEMSSLTPAEKSNAEVILSNADFSTIEEVRMEYYRAVALAKLNSNTDVSLMGDYITDKLYLDLSRYSLLDNKDEVLSAITAKNYTKFTDFECDFYEAVCLNDINSSDRNDIKTVLLANKNSFSADFMKLTEYQFGLVGVSVLSKRYSSFAELDKAVSAAVSEALENKDVTSSPMISDNISDRDINKPNGGAFVPVLQKKSAVYQAATEGEYIDLDKAEWAREAVECLTKKGIVSGYGDGSFCPDMPLTREEFVKIIVSAFYPDTQGFATSNVFTDVKSDKWYSLYVNIAYEKGLISGISETEFGVGRNITREDMVVIITRAVKYNDENPILDFADNDKISEYAKSAVYNLTSRNIISGYDDGTFKPQLQATRAVAAKVVYDILKSENKL